MDHYTIEPYDTHWAVRGKAGQGRIQALASCLDADLLAVANDRRRSLEEREDALQASLLIRHAQHILKKHKGFGPKGES